MTKAISNLFENGGSMEFHPKPRESYKYKSRTCEYCLEVFAMALKMGPLFHNMNMS
jgi:hypothetical protein